MKQRISLIIVIFFLLTIGIQSCKKDDIEAKNNQQYTRVINLSELPTYYNGVLTESFSENDYNPTRSSDMDLTSIVDTIGIYYFDQDSIFNEFCTANQMEFIYENSAKLSKIHEKAKSLGLIYNNSDTIPQEMSDYWQSTFGTNIQESMQAQRAIFLKVFDGYNYNGESMGGIWPCRANLKRMDNKTSSISFYVGLGSTVMCHNKWFGGTKKWFWLLGLEASISLENEYDDNKFSSYVCFLI